MTWTLYSAHGRERDVDQCLVMGILNATPDSFSDGGALARDLDGAIDAMLRAGADILDVGGESTRPGHAPVSAEEEIRRVVPVIQAIRQRSDAWISIDTSKARVAAAALDAGADFVNDVTGLGDTAMARIVRNRGCSIVLMRHADCHGDIVRAAKQELRALLVRARASGISDAQVVLDAGLGFGARPGPDVADNLALLDGTAELGMGYPVLVGHSRKRFVVQWANVEGPLHADGASAELSRRAMDAGAAIVRVHDVAATKQALQ